MSLQVVVASRKTSQNCLYDSYSGRNAPELFPVSIIDSKLSMIIIGERVSISIFSLINSISVWSSSGSSVSPKHSLKIYLAVWEKDSLFFTSQITP